MVGTEWWIMNQDDEKRPPSLADKLESGLAFVQKFSRVAHIMCGASATIGFLTALAVISEQRNLIAGSSPAAHRAAG